MTSKGSNLQERIDIQKADLARCGDLSDSLLYSSKKFDIGVIKMRIAVLTSCLEGGDEND